MRSSKSAAQSARDPRRRVNRDTDAWTPFWIQIKFVKGISKVYGSIKFYIWDIKIDIDPFMVLFRGIWELYSRYNGSKLWFYEWGSVGLTKRLSWTQKKLEAWSEQNLVNHKKRTQEMIEMWRPNSVWPIARRGFSGKGNGQLLQVFLTITWSSFSSRKVTVWMGNHGTNTTR